MTTPLADATAPACVICLRTLWADEWDRYACRLCQQRTADHLAAIPGYFARLDATPGRRGGGSPVSGSRTAPAPCSIPILNRKTEKGPILAPLETWVRDWQERNPRIDINEAGDETARAAYACSTLRFNLDWATTHHPAFDEFAREIASIHRDLRSKATGEPAAQTIRLACPCGRVLAVTLDTLGWRCGCGVQYDRSALFGLSVAERRQIAA